MASDRREKLVQTALTLFSKHGIRATGIDTIVAEAGVAKMTLYNHFKSKDELVVAALRRFDEEFRNALMRAVERKGRTPSERLLALFDFLDGLCNRADFFGCKFINASAEYTAHDHPVHIAAAEHKKLVLIYVRNLAAAAGAQGPDQLSEQLFFLMEGALVAAHVSGQTDACIKARRAAEVLIRVALDSTPRAGLD